MSMYKVKSAIVGGAVAAVMAVTALSGTIIQAMSDNSYKSWKQYGESWSGMNLGASSDTVAQSGCAVTSAAILMVHSGAVTDDSFNPGTLVSFMSANGGFTSSGCILWSVLSEYTPSFSYCGKTTLSGSQRDKTAEMQRLINEGYVLMAEVKYGGHYVAIDTVSGSNVTMMDPGSRSTSLYDTYSPDGIYSVQMFKGAYTVGTAEEETVTVETTEPIETTVTEVVTTEPEVLYTTAPETAPLVIETEAVEETTEVTTTQVTETETTTTETTKETTTTAVTTFIAPEITETVPTQTTVDTAAEALTPAPTLEDIPELPTDAAAEEPAAEQVIPSHAEAGLFQIGGQDLFMTVRFTTTDILNLREEPNTDSEILLEIPEGTALNVVEINEDFTWGRVAYNGKEGWISIDFARL